MNEDNTVVAGGGLVQNTRNIRRIKWIASCIEYLQIEEEELPPTMYKFWYNDLTEEERNTKEIVYQILEHKHDEVYGESPWRRKTKNVDMFETGYDILPDAFRTDPKAFIALTKSKDFESTCQYSWNKISKKCFRDNFDCMKAACSCDSDYLLDYASPRFRDNEEIVRVALFRETRLASEVIKYVSERLKRDKNFISDCLKHDVNNWDPDRSKLQHSNSYWVQDVLPGRFDLNDQLFFLHHIPLQEIPYALRYFPQEIRNDKTTILQLLKDIEPSKASDLVSACSEKLQADTDVSKTMKRKMILSGKDNIWYNEGKTANEIQKAIAAKEITSFANIPESIRYDPEIVKSAIVAGIIASEDVPKEHFQKKETVLAMINASIDDEIYFYLPDHLKKDLAISLAMICKIECRYCWKDIFDNVPSLGRSRQALFSFINYGYSTGNDGYDNDSYEYSDASKYLRNFSHDKEMMLALFDNKMESCYKVVDIRFLNDRDFMKSASEYSSSFFITLATPEFQVRNLDLVEKAISNLLGEALVGRDKYDNFFEKLDYFFGKLAPEVWTHRSIVMKYLTRDVVLHPNMSREGWDTYHIMNELHDFRRRSPFLNDREVISLLVGHNPNNFASASNELKNDREFVLQLVKEHERVLHHAGKTLKYDEEILTAALAKNAGSLVDCFDLLKSTSDENFLLEYARTVRSKLDRHDMFVQDFLGGISIPNGSNGPLYKLDQGIETSLVFTRLIAEFADVPVGNGFITYKAASTILQRFGLC